MSITVKDLSKHFGAQKAVDNISFSTAAGKIVGFLGPNGAGKSTTMRMLACYLSPTGGQAFVAGFDIASQSKDVKNRLGYLPENTPLYGDMYVKEFLAFIAESYSLKNIKQKVQETINRVGLQSEQHKLINTLSKGYKQRVGLAQAIIHDPEVLLLDEPTSGLDPNQLVEIRSLIKELGKNRTVILSTHIMQEVEALCDEVIIINKGKIVANDTLEGLKSVYKQKDLETIFRELTTTINQ